MRGARFGGRAVFIGSHAHNNAKLKSIVLGPPFGSHPCARKVGLELAGTYF